MENIVYFPISVICFWIKGSFAIMDKTLTVDRMNAILGFIPAGRETRSIPLKSISACIMNKYYDAQSIFLGIILIMTGTGCIAGGTFVPLSIMMTIIGLIVISGSIRTVISIQNNGTEFNVFIPFYAADKAARIKRMVDGAVDRVNA